jgi:undecaprenyl-diphosphatase
MSVPLRRRTATATRATSALRNTPLHEPAAHLDRAVDAAFEAIRGDPLADRVFYAASELGNFSLLWHLLGLADGMHSPTHARAALRFSAALGVEAVLVNQVLKRIFDRSRPMRAQPYPHPHPLRRPRTSSFPSGHASAAAFSAVLLSARRPRLAPAYAVIAVVVAGSRVYVGDHHASDVVAGAVVGAALGAVARRWV